MNVPQRFLYVDDDGLRAYRRERRRLYREAAFAGDESGLAEFSRYLEGCGADDAFTLLADIAGETLQVETIPALRGGERRSVIERRQARHFPGCRHMTAIPLGRERHRRQDERLLLAALSEGQTLDRWLGPMRDGGIAIAGIHSPSLLAGELLRHIAADAAAPTLLFLHDEGRLREIYCVGGQALFTRTVPADGDEMTVATLAGEAARLQRYLSDRGLLDGDGPLRAIVVADTETIARLGALPPAVAGFDIVTADTAGCARSCGLPDNSDLPELLLQLLARRPPRHQFAAATLLRRHRLHRTASAMLAAGSAALVVAILFAGLRMHQADALAGRTERLRAETAVLEQRHRLLAATLPPGWSPAAISTLVARHAELVAGGSAPREFLGGIGRALAAVPEVRLSRLGWQSDDSGNGRLHLVLHGETPRLSALDELVDRLHADRRLSAGRDGATVADGPAGRRFSLPLTWQTR